MPGRQRTLRNVIFCTAVVFVRKLLYTTTVAGSGSGILESTKACLRRSSGETCAETWSTTEASGGPPGAQTPRWIDLFFSLYKEHDRSTSSTDKEFVVD